MFDQMSGYPITQSSGHIELTITGLVFLVCETFSGQTFFVFETKFLMTRPHCGALTLTGCEEVRMRLLATPPEALFYSQNSTTPILPECSPKSWLALLPSGAISSLSQDIVGLSGPQAKVRG